MSQSPHAESSPLSRPASVAATPPEGLEIDIVANDAERAALADLNGLVAIPALTAKLRVKRWRGEGLEVEGEVRATVRQNCVVTLEPFDAEIVSPLHLRFAPLPEENARRRPRDSEVAEHEIDFSGEDPPDPMIGGVLVFGPLLIGGSLTMTSYLVSVSLGFARGVPIAGELLLGLAHRV